MANKENVIETKNLYFAYEGNKYILKNINLQIKRGEIIAILGENGAGKTTLIKHFNGLLKPSKGEVYILGKNTKESSVAELSRHVGIVFQNPDHQIFSETVEKEIEFAMRNFGFDKSYIKERVEWALRLMGLEKYRNRSPYTLSIGERKRLTLAAVLSYDPDILILDEPTAGQDFLQKERIAEMMNLLRHRQKTVIMVTHDIEFIVNRVERIIILAKGEILYDGDKREVLTNLQLLKKARLLPPQITQIAWLLQDNNIGVPTNILYIEELLNELLHLCKKVGLDESARRIQV
ncbi:MAG: ABC transporter ATP-binding protein [Thermofilum sp. ex4484_79]|nr:MAG: ABC transporter ATP-binding protein [Thermofilum sp. ex4484_79]